MAYTYVLTGYDDQDNLIVEHGITADEAVVILANAIRKAQSTPHAEDDEHEQAVSRRKGRTQSKATGRRKERVCSICGKPGHDVRKCPKGKGLHPDNPRDEDTAPLVSEDAGFQPSSRNSGRVKELLKAGHDDEFIANEVGTKIRTVAFIRRQMTARGEL